MNNASPSRTRRTIALAAAVGAALSGTVLLASATSAGPPVGVAAYLQRFATAHQSTLTPNFTSISVRATDNRIASTGFDPATAPDHELSSEQTTRLLVDISECSPNACTQTSVDAPIPDGAFTTNVEEGTSRVQMSDGGCAIDLVWSSSMPGDAARAEQDSTTNTADPSTDATAGSSRPATVTGTVCGRQIATSGEHGARLVAQASAGHDTLGAPPPDDPGSGGGLPSTGSGAAAPALAGMMLVLGAAAARVATIRGGGSA